MKKVVCLLAAFGFSGIAVAVDNPSNFVCEKNGIERRIEIVREVPGALVPCQVRYHKPSESQAEPKVLYSAQNDPNYCSDRAQAFADKLQSNWGWICKGL